MVEWGTFKTWNCFGMKSLLWQWFIWARRLVSAVVLLMVAYFSLTDTDGMRMHEIQHLLAHIYRYTGLQADKVVHIIMYFSVCGGLWIGLPLRLWGRPSAVWAFWMAVGWGVLMEVCQWGVSACGLVARSFDMADVFANTFGAFVAFVICLVTTAVLMRFCPMAKRLYPQMARGSKRMNDGEGR